MVGMGKLVKRECPVCGIHYDADSVRLRHGRQTTCSRKCSYVLRGDQKKLGATFTCPVCESEFTRTPKQIKSKHGAVFCSRECHYRGRTLGLSKRVVVKPYTVTDEGRAGWLVGAAKTVAIRRARDNYGHSDDTRARLAETTARAIADGRIPTVSRVEDEVADALDALGIGYRRQVSVRGALGRYVACVDFMLDDGRALEVNGTFWHADPRSYPDGPVYPSQRRTHERWCRKVAALESLGIALVVVWEYDVEQGACDAVAGALTDG